MFPPGSSFGGTRPQHKLRVYDAYNKKEVALLPIAYPLFHMQWDHKEKELLALANMYDPAYGRNVTLVRIDLDTGVYTEVTNVSPPLFFSSMLTMTLMLPCNVADGTNHRLPTWSFSSG